MDQLTPEQALQILDRAMQPSDARAPFTRADYVNMEVAFRLISSTLTQLQQTVEQLQANTVKPPKAGK